MGNKSTEEFLYFFEQLPEDAKNTLLDYFKKNKKGISKEFQSALDRIEAKLKVGTKLDVTALQNQIKDVTKKLTVDLSAVFKAMGGVYNGSSWSNIPQYANGGLPSHGTLFTAGENGAEIVGNINRRTEVLNRSQIASAIYTAVSDAMKNANIGGGEIHLYAHTDEGVIVDRINQKTKQTGRCPINIPV